MAERKKPHVVIYPHAAQGHVTPMMQLAKRLAGRGFTVTFVNTEHIISRLVLSQTQSGIPLPQEQGLDIRFVGIPDGLPEDHPRTSNIPELLRAVEKLAQPFAEVIEEINKKEDESPVSCIISDVINSHTQDLANKLGIPRVAFWTPSACSASMYMHAPMLVEKGIVPVQDSGEELVTCIPGVHPVPRKDLPHFLTEGGFMLERVTVHAQRVLDAACVIMNTFHELEGPALDALSQMVPITPIGPLLPPAFFEQGSSSSTTNNRHGTGVWPEDDKCLSWLDEQQPSSVLYISFGSIIKVAGAQFQELALGLEASMQPFLWVMRPDMNEGMSSFCEEFRERTKDRGFITSWVPQLMVLSHRSVGGFLTHNGWNSTLESICAGIPMLCWPGFADQFANARYVVEVWKVGMRFQRGEDGLVSRVEVERVVTALMQGSEGKPIGEAARKMRDAARKTVLPGGSSYQNFEAFIDFLTQSATKAQRKY